METGYMITSEICCRTCVYFVRHYVRGETGWFVPLSCGHCGIGQNRSPVMDDLCSLHREVEDVEAACVAYQINWKWD